jgi:F-type H+-transporting ATPase subunit b
MCDLFARRLREMDASSKKSLADAIRAQGGPSTVSSAFDMPEGARAVLQKAINETFSADVHLRFETMPNLICGIELAAKGQKVAWSIADYLSALENEVKELLKKREKPRPAPAIPSPAVAKPEPAPAKPETVAAKPEPAPAKLDPAAAKPEPASAKPEPSAAKPEPAPAKPEPAAAKPEPAPAKPEPAAEKSEPASAKPEPAAKKPEPAAAKPEPAPAVKGA